MVIKSFQSGEVTLLDTYASGTNQPKYDDQQDVTAVSGSEVLTPLLKLFHFQYFIKLY